MARKPKAKRAKGAGRPPLPEAERREGTSIRVLPITIERARAIGGTVSRGVEMAVTEYWAGIQPKVEKRK